MKHHFRFHLTVPRVGRQISDEKLEIIEPQHIAAWKAIASMHRLNNFTIQNNTYKIKIKLDPIFKQIQLRLNRHIEFYRTKNYSIFEDLNDQPTIIKIDSEV